MYCMLQAMWIGAAALTLILSAREPVRAENPQRTIVFGCPLALTGALSKEGHLAQEGYDFWARYANAHGGLRVGGDSYSVAIRYIDDASTPADTARAAEQLIRVDHVNFLLGPYGSAATFAAAAIAEKHAVPMISSSGAAERTFDQGYHFIFGVLSPARKYFAGIIEFAVRRTPRPQTVAISSASDEFSREVQQGAVQSANDHGMRVVYAQQYAGDSGSVDAAAATMAGHHPDIVLNAGHLQDAIALHRALLQHGVAAKIYGYTNGPDIPDFRDVLGASAQGVFGSAQWSPAVSYYGDPGFYRTAAAYTTAFTNDTGHAPDYHAAEATAAGIAFADAITGAGSLNPNAVRSALSHLNVMTFFGPIRFDERGVNVYKPMVINQIQGASLVTVYPYRLAKALPIDRAPNGRDRKALVGQSADVTTHDFRIETDQTESDLNDGRFTMPHRIRFIRPGTDVVGDSAKGNTRDGLVTITGHAVLQQTIQPSERAAATVSGSPATLRCDQLQIDAKRKLYVATGNVVYVQGLRRATAQHGRFDQGAHALVLYGNVRLTDGEQILSAPSVHYDTLTNKVISKANP